MISNIFSGSLIGASFVFVGYLIWSWGNPYKRNQERIKELERLPKDDVYELGSFNCPGCSSSMSLSYYAEGGKFHVRHNVTVPNDEDITLPEPETDLPNNIIPFKKNELSNREPDNDGAA